MNKKNSKNKPSRSDKPVKGRYNRNKREAESIATQKGKDYENAFAWYNKNPALLESAARIPFATPAGGKLPLVTLSGGTGNDVQYYYLSSGIMRIGFTPAIGFSDASDSPASIAAREIYAKVRKAYSGTLAVDAPDFMMYLLALDGIYSYIASLKRIYRCINVYSGDNRYLPNALISALVDSTDVHLTDKTVKELTAGKTRLWGIINTLIANVSKFTCPAVMDIFSRHYWMNDNVYIDRPSTKGQLYVMVEDAFFQFKLDGESRGSVGLLSAPSPTNTDNYIDLLQTYGETLIDALNGDEDAYTINGYLMRAFEGYPMFTIEQLKEDEILEVVHSPEVLTQIHNANCLGGSTMVTDYGVTQDGLSDIVYSKPQMPVKSGNLYNRLTVDLDSAVPTVEETAIATRLMHAVIKSSSSPKTYDIHCGTEIVQRIHIIAALNMSDGSFQYRWLELPFNSVNASIEYVEAMIKLTEFDWAPLYPVIVNIGTESATKWVIGQIGDVTNITAIKAEDLQNLNRMCVYSEFNSFTM